MIGEHLTQTIGELVPRPVLDVETQPFPLTVGDLTDPAEIWAVTQLGAPTDNPALKERVLAIRGVMLFESSRTQPGNERYVALHALKQQVDRARQAQQLRRYTDKEADWITTTGQA